MGRLQNAFENKETLKEASFLERLFSSPVVRGFYKEEAPAVPLRMEGGKNEKLRLTSLINTIAKNSPTGREVLKTAAEAGYTISFRYMPDTFGFCRPSEKTLCLNPVYPDKKLISTLVHESRHAQQFTQRFSRRFGFYDMATTVKLNRALEADADATALQSLLEIRAVTKQNDFLDRFEKAKPPVVKNITIPPLSDSLETVVKNRDKTMQDAFKGWFKDRPLVKSYEREDLFFCMKDILRMPCEKKKRNFDMLLFQESLPSAKIVKMFCKTENGKCYFDNDPDVMDTNDEMRCITPETYMTAKSFFAERQKLTGRPADKSIESLPKSDTLFKNEAFSHMAGLNNEKPETAEQEKTTATAPSLMTLLKNRSR